MEEIFEKIGQMLGEAFTQGEAHQRMQDASSEFNESGAVVQKLWLEIRETLQPSEEEKVN